MQDLEVVLMSYKYRKWNLSYVADITMYYASDRCINIKFSESGLEGKSKRTS
jgi:hypothetical protein